MRSLSRAVNVRRRGRADNSDGADAGAATTVSLWLPSLAAPAMRRIVDPGAGACPTKVAIFFALAWNGQALAWRCRQGPGALQG